MTAGRLQAAGGETLGPVLTSEPRCCSPPALPASWCSHTPQRTLTEDPQRAKICVQIRVKRKNTFPGDQKRPRSSKGSGTSLPKKKARRKKRLQKSSRKLIQESRE